MCDLKLHKEGCTCASREGVRESSGIAILSLNSGTMLRWAVFLPRRSLYCWYPLNRLFVAGVVEKFHMWDCPRWRALTICELFSASHGKVDNLSYKNMFTFLPVRLTSSAMWQLICSFCTKFSPWLAETQYFSITVKTWSLLVRETNSLCRENHTKHRNTLYGQNSWYLHVKAGGISS